MFDLEQILHQIPSLTLPSIYLGSHWQYTSLQPPEAGFVSPQKVIHMS